MNLVFYSNGSAGNHGCEAITRGTIALLGEKNNYIVQSGQVEEDIRYGLDELTEIRPAVTKVNKNFSFLIAYIKLKATGAYTDMDGLAYIPSIKQSSKEAKVALSLGGDNYCYPGTEIYGWLNNEYHKNGMKTVLWGCSVEPEIIANSNVAKDLTCYDLIVARESITYKAILKVQKNVILAPDPGFFMGTVECKLDKRMCFGNVIGINISPHILKCELSCGIAYENYKQLVTYILNNTDAYVALIPHVVWASNDDRIILRKLYDDFKQDPRLILVEDHTAPELKYIISKCSFFIGARTHATIAAYSTGVPTLVVGYSVKAQGIARDLFGNESDYVLPVQQLRDSDELTQAFCKLYEKRSEIRLHLISIMPGYISRAEDARKALEELVKQ